MSRQLRPSEIPHLDQFRQAVDRLRRDLGLSQNQLARRVGIDPALINRLLRGLPVDRPYHPSQSAVLSITLALDCTPALTDRLLWLAGHAPIEDYQTRAEVAELALEGVRDALRWSERGRPASNDQASPVPNSGVRVVGSSPSSSERMT